MPFTVHSRLFSFPQVSAITIQAPKGTQLKIPVPVDTLYRLHAHAEGSDPIRIRFICRDELSEGPEGSKVLAVGAEELVQGDAGRPGSVGWPPGPVFLWGAG